MGEAESQVRGQAGGEGEAEAEGGHDEAAVSQCDRYRVERSLCPPVTPALSQIWACRASVPSSVAGGCPAAQRRGPGRSQEPARGARPAPSPRPPPSSPSQ